MTCLNRTIQDDWDDLLEGKMREIQLATVVWNKYTGKPEELPVIYHSVLIKKRGLGVFSGFVPKFERFLWAPHTLADECHDIEPGDWWAYYPDPPKREGGAQ
jgi:hypothetical protein